MTGGERLRSVRAYLGMDQAQMGSELGFSIEHISRLENGRRLVTPCTLLALKYLVLRHELRPEQCGAETGA